jgi:hypothetical protein
LAAGAFWLAEFRSGISIARIHRNLYASRTYEGNHKSCDIASPRVKRGKPIGKHSDWADSKEFKTMLEAWKSFGGFDVML